MPKSDRVHCVRFRSGDLEILCWVCIADGVQVGRCAASAATAWAPSIEERSEEVGVMVYHHWSTSPSALEARVLGLYAVNHM